MDIRNSKWFAQLQISGVGQPINHSGSVLSVFAEILKDLGSTNPRALSAGEREIVIRIRDKPFGSAKESTERLDRILDVAAGLDDSEVDSGPRDGEDYTAFTTRLLATDISVVSAIAIAADWFDEPPPPGLQEWMSDQKAIRFRQLNSSREAYESAPPGEYPELKRYVTERFPQFTFGLTFRQA